MQYKLIVCDLDGTLLSTNKTISDKNIEALEYFKREGGYFTFITGRLPYYATDAYNSVKCTVKVCADKNSVKLSHYKSP